MRKRENDRDFPGNNLVVPDLYANIIFTIDSKAGLVKKFLFLL